MTVATTEDIQLINDIFALFNPEYKSPVWKFREAMRALLEDARLPSPTLLDEIKLPSAAYEVVQALRENTSEQVNWLASQIPQLEQMGPGAVPPESWAADLAGMKANLAQLQSRAAACDPNPKTGTHSLNAIYATFARPVYIPGE